MASAEDAAIVETASDLRRRKEALGAAYWQDAAVIALQARLRRLIGQYGAWSENKLPMHQRARQAARYEQECADLLWPGREST